MFVVVTATSRLLYTLIVLSLDRRRIVHFEVTANPTQDWLSGQMTEAFPWDTAPRYLLRDRDKSYGPAFRQRVRAMGITEVITAPRSPVKGETATIEPNVWHDWWNAGDRDARVRVEVTPGERVSMSEPREAKECFDHLEGELIVKCDGQTSILRKACRISCSSP
jgi:hypothetical protein